MSAVAAPEKLDLPGDPPPVIIPASPKLAAPARTFHIVELRCRILEYLEPADLATFMRVQKESIKDVARLLYHTVEFDQAWYTMKRDTPEQIIYCDAVTQIDAETFTVPIDVRSQISGDVHYHGFNRAKIPEWETLSEHGDAQQAGYQTTYRADIMFLTLGTLRRRFPHVRIAAFGSHAELGADAWQVHFAARTVTAPTASPRSHAPGLRGHVDLVHTRSFSCTSPPPKSLHPPIAPDPDYSIREMFDLHIYFDPDVADGPPLYYAWSTALRNNRCFGNVYKAVQTSDIPFSLADLAGLYQHQIAADHGERIETIIAHSTLPWRIDEMRKFARIASSSLVSLYLSWPELDAESEDETLVSFSDLPTLIPIIRDNLSNLRELQIALKGVETAESVCWEFLHPGSLDEGGTIERLNIATNKHPTPLFNTIRCLSSLCTATAIIDLANDGSEPWAPYQQINYLHYLRAQTPLRKRALAQIDFVSIGIVDPSDLDRLVYSDDGSPRHLSYGAPAAVSPEEEQGEGTAERWMSLQAIADAVEGV